jgi:hypothetical protein
MTDEEIKATLNRAYDEWHKWKRSLPDGEMPGPSVCFTEGYFRALSALSPTPPPALPAEAVEKALSAAAEAVPFLAGYESMMRRASTQEADDARDVRCALVEALAAVRAADK